MQQLLLWIGLGYIVNFILTIIVVCFQRRDPVVSLAWVMCFILLPVGGPVIFLVFGTGLKAHTKKQYHQKLLHDVEISKLMEVQNGVMHSEEVKRLPYSDIATYLLRAAQSPYMINNSVKIFTDASDKYKALLDDIAAAKTSIHLVYFIIRDDEIGNRVLSLLTKKAASGVEVRFLYDDIGCLTTPKDIFKPLITAGGHVSAFFPLSKGLQSKINHRNHRKMAIIDGKIGYLGGMNIGDEYMGKKKLCPWRDTHIRIIGQSVRFIQKLFILDWEFSTHENLSSMDKYFSSTDDAVGNVEMQIVASGPDSKMEQIKCGMIKMLNDADYYVYIQTPYFVPDKAFMTSLLIAAQSGADVRIMLPGKPDKPYVYYVSKSYIGELLDAGIRVYLHKGFIHSKTMVIDDAVSTIGTSNIDIRSFQLHFEVNAFMYSKETAMQCKRIFENDIKDCTELTRSEYQKRGIVNIMLEGFFRLFSPLM